jgi:hypothetical protein
VGSGKWIMWRVACAARVWTGIRVCVCYLVRDDGWKCDGGGNGS